MGPVCTCRWNWPKWRLVLLDRFRSNEKRARALFRFRIWYWEDLLPCEDHSVVKCLCTECQNDNLCSEPGCQVHPPFNVPGSPPLKCAAHKTPGMVNVRIKMCSEPGCPVQAYFNLPGKPVLKCAAHKTPKWSTSATRRAAILVVQFERASM